MEKWPKREKRERREKSSFPKKKWTPVFEAGKEIDLKDIKLLSRFVTERGRILPRKITGLTAQQQRKITNAVKRARQMSLLPFISYTS
jgi:small subunit ribosomal protein S18